jgi:hypothetical protein
MVLRGPYWSLPFHISTNASDLVVGAFLGQKENVQTYVIYFIIKKLTHVELNYTVTKKEFLAVIHIDSKFKNYITRYDFFSILNTLLSGTS